MGEQPAMTKQKTFPRYQWQILQTGQLPLRPEGRIIKVEHRCTSVLVWPDGASPTPGNSLVVDPCFTRSGYQEAVRQLAPLGITFEQLVNVFITHPHGDHLPEVPPEAHRVPLHLYQPAAGDSLAAVPCPGHHSLAQALTFYTAAGESVWIVGDSILDEDWLRQWNYYWPNGYTPGEVIETWHSVAAILSQADIVVPGHGLPFEVTAALLGEMLSTFPYAPYMTLCLDVADRLRARLVQLERKIYGG